MENRIRRKRSGTEAADAPHLREHAVKPVQCQFYVGQLVHHALFDYRGVVVDVDPEFQGTEDWYQQVARSKPPKDRPWYHILVHKGQHMTYVAERNLEPDRSKASIDHPLISHFFTRFEKGKYIRPMN